MSTVLEMPLFPNPPAKRTLSPTPPPARENLASLNWAVVQVLEGTSYISTVFVAWLAPVPPAKIILFAAAPAARATLASLNWAVVQVLREHHIYQRFWKEQRQLPVRRQRALYFLMQRQPGHFLPYLTGPWSMNRL